MKKVASFTLIELLIAVGIIAILAAIAVPNYMEAQVRAKVSRTQNDLRILAGAINAFVTDHNKFIDNYSQLMTPVAYISSLPVDPFLLPEQHPYACGKKPGGDYTDWVVSGCGPNKIIDNIRYDSTNGTRSNGDIIYERKPSSQYYAPPGL